MGLTTYKFNTLCCIPSFRHVLLSHFVGIPTKCAALASVFCSKVVLQYMLIYFYHHVKLSYNVITDRLNVNFKISTNPMYSALIPPPNFFQNLLKSWLAAQRLINLEKPYVSLE